MGDREQQSIKYPSIRNKKEKSLAIFINNIKKRKQLLTQEEIALCKSIPGWNWNGGKNDNKIFKTKKDVMDFISEWKKSGNKLAIFCKSKNCSQATFWRKLKLFNIKCDYNLKYLKNG